MGSLAGAFQRPIFTAAAVAVASVSTDLPNKLSNSKSSDASIASEALNSQVYDGPPSSEFSCVSHISVSKLARLSFASRIRVPVPNINHHPIPNSSFGFVGNHVESSSRFVSLYQSAELAKAWKPKIYSYSSESVPSKNLYKWHLPEPSVVDVASKSNCSSAKSRTVVVLLGWLGAKQKHLKKYAEWYTSRGFHVITFTFPMYEVLSYQVGGKAEQDVKLLVNHLADWLEEEHGKNLVFHTFSNTGWLTYGVVLEKFQKQDPPLGDRIKGCIVDSAPVASADPQVWASGFSAAFLKKQSVATKGLTASCDTAKEGSIVARTVNEPKPAVTESALLVLLEKFFEVVLKLPPVNRRLTDVMGLLSWKQPNCPQLYIYSSSDRVIPARCVESFIEQQRKSGHEVRSCNFVSTPHVDHFRHDPHLYTSQLTHFLEDCVLKCCKGSFSIEPN